MELKELGRQKLEWQNTWQFAKDSKSDSDRTVGLKREPLLVLDCEQRGLAHHKNWDT